MEKQSKKEYVHAVERAVDILQAFTYEEAELSLARLSEQTGYPKTTTYRLLTTLENQSFVVQNPETGRYRLGYEMIRLGAIARASNPIAKVAHEELERISSDTQQTCNLYIRDGFERICVDQVAGTEYVHRHSFLGARHPLYCGAGKLILAYAGRAFQKRFFDAVTFERFTEKTRSKEELQEELEQILADGYSVSRGERDATTAMVSAPLFDYTQRAVASITVSGPVFVFTDEQVERYIRILLEAAARISYRMGYQKDRPIVMA